ncbi:hypothetical protein PRZ48_000006 [Zasmidium cellare]|uniref:Uncharacterized protein n=1 Tax=Zasmidium cellare TaxID=395010 RepID=A0ABR0EYN9_ZASCE|nr:hypothetical protein PRZ48_000006 [Zasmidium cellare]
MLRESKAHNGGQYNSTTAPPVSHHTLRNAMIKRNAYSRNHRRDNSQNHRPQDEEQAAERTLAAVKSRQAVEGQAQDIQNLITKLLTSTIPPRERQERAAQALFQAYDQVHNLLGHLYERRESAWKAAHDRILGEKNILQEEVDQLRQRLPDEAVQSKQRTELITRKTELENKLTVAQQHPSTLREQEQFLLNRVSAVSSHPQEDLRHGVANVCNRYTAVRKKLIQQKEVYGNRAARHRSRVRDQQRRAHKASQDDHASNQQAIRDRAASSSSTLQAQNNELWSTMTAMQYTMLVSQRQAAFSTTLVKAMRDGKHAVVQRMETAEEQHKLASNEVSQLELEVEEWKISLNRTQDDLLSSRKNEKSIQSRLDGAMKVPSEAGSCLSLAHTTCFGPSAVSDTLPCLKMLFENAPVDRKVQKVTETVLHASLQPSSVLNAKGECVACPMIGSRL